MGHDRTGTTEERDALSHEVLGAAIAVHRAMGPGLLESVYEACLSHELGKRRIPFRRGVRLPIIYDGALLSSYFRLDLLVEGNLVVELKSVESILPVHMAQLITYLRLGGFRRGLLINFNVVRLMKGVTRVVV